MSKYALALVAGLIATPAMSADISPATYKAPAPIVSPAYNWSGFYLGAHGGYGFDGSIQDVTNSGADKRNIEGGFGGLQAGYNWQGINSPFVFGLEADVSFGSISKSWGGTNQFDPYYGKDSVKTNGTFRGRLGYSFDRLLVFATGGLAWGEVENGFGCDANRVVATNGCQHKVGGQAFYTTNNSTEVGYVIGGGLEYAFWDRWSVKGEYTYTDLGKKTVNMIDPNYPAAKSERNFETKFSNVKFGVNYRF